MFKHQVLSVNDDLNAIEMHPQIVERSEFNEQNNQIPLSQVIFAKNRLVKTENKEIEQQNEQQQLETDAQKAQGQPIDYDDFQFYQQQGFEEWEQCSNLNQQQICEKFKNLSGFSQSNLINGSSRNNSQQLAFIKSMMADQSGLKNLNQSSLKNNSVNQNLNVVENQKQVQQKKEITTKKLKNVTEIAAEGNYQNYLNINHSDEDSQSSDFHDFSQNQIGKNKQEQETSRQLKEFKLQ